MLKIDGPPQFHPVGELLTPQCHTLVIEGDSWQEDAQITQMECYGGTVSVIPENTPRPLGRHQTNVLALGSLGFGNKEIADATGLSAGGIKNIRTQVTKQAPGHTRASFAGFECCIAPYICYDVLQVSPQPTADAEAEIATFPPYVADAIHAREKGRSLDGVAYKHDLTPYQLEQNLMAFRQKRGIPGRGPNGLILFGYVKGIA